MSLPQFSTSLATAAGTSIHPAVIRFRKTKKKAIQQACWLEHTRYRHHCHHARWLPPPLHQAFHPRKKFIHHRQRTDSTHQKKLIHKSIRASQTKEKGSTHHKSTHPQIDSYITDKGAGFNTNKITHLQIDSHNIEGGKGRGGQEGEIGDAAGQAKSLQR